MRQYKRIYEFSDCGGNINSPVGVIRSPGFPDNYEALKNCEWVISAPNGQQIELIVNNFTLEYQDDCAFDYLEIR